MLTRRYYSISLIIFTLIVCDVFVIATVLRDLRSAKTSSVALLGTTHPMVLGDSTSPLTIRGEPAPTNSSVPIPIKAPSYEQIRAKSFLVYDTKTNIILGERNSHTKMAIASLTKLLTALVVYEHSRMDDVVTVSASDPITENPVLGLKAGDKIALGDLFNAMLVGSANDAAATLANHIQEKTGISFPILMNNRARELGMVESSFSNPLGFDSARNYSTAHDLSLLTGAISNYAAFKLQSKALEYQFTSLEGSKYKIKATNQLTASNPELSAIKTGFTEQANGAMITSAARDGNEIILIVLNSTDRENDTLRLKDEIFSDYRWQ